MGKSVNEKRIGVIDGIRTFAILWVAWYHLWQESWLTPYVDLKINLPRYFGINSIEISNFVRYGFLFVDVTMILSAFCVFLPFAKSIIDGEQWPDLKNYYLKRAIRILPSYYLTVLVYFFAYALPNHKYETVGFMWKDLITHFTFTSWLFPDTYYLTESNGVLWAVQIEVVFYVLIPWIAKLIKKLPEVTYIGMLLIGIVSTNAFLLHSKDLRAVENNPLSYFPVYANGILLCIIYTWWKKKKMDNRYTQICGTIISIGSVFFFRRIIQWYIDTENLSICKLQFRLVSSFIFCIFIFATLCSNNIYQKFFANKLTQLFTIISYNYFIWHQGVFRLLKAIRIPYWEGEELPNMSGNTEWMYKYTAVSIVLSVIVAILFTKLYDIPVTRYLTGKFIKNTRKMKDENN